MPEGDDDLLAILLFGAIAGSSESTETRMKALVPIPDSFRLTVYRQGIFSSIGKAFGMEDIAIGDAKFDEQFVVKSSDAATARRFLSDPYLRDLIDCQRNGVIEVQSQISFECPGAMKNPDRIVRLFELFIELIRQSRSLSD